MGRFSVENRFRRVSIDQFKDTGEKLKSALERIRPELTSELLLTTDGIDYRGHGSLTILTPEVEEARNRREQYQLSDLNEELWQKSFKTGLYFKDNSIKEPYMVCLTTEDREPKKMFFYSQCLDEESQEVFDSFKRAGLLQKIGDGFPKTSNFAIAHALARLSS